MKKKYTKYFWILLMGSLVVVVLHTIGLSKKNAFIKTLQQLVSNETHGQYKLEVEDGDFDLIELSFQLNSVRLENLDTVGKGIRQVLLPKINANLGSLRSLFSIGQLKVENISVDEPVIQLYSKVKHDTLGNITNHLVSIAKGVEAILNKFDVKDFRILKANMNIKKPGDQDLEIGFIDLLVGNWNMRHLESSASVNVLVGKQDILLGELSVGFSSIEYRYPQHYLYFNDVSITREDTVAFTSIKSKEVRIRALDYEELYYNQNYNLRKIEIINPEISIVQKKDILEKRSLNINELFPKLQSLLGKVEVDSVIIHDGNVDVTMRNRHYGLVHINLTDFDFLISGISLENDMSSTGFRTVKIHASNSSLSLGTQGHMSFGNLDFTNNGLLQIDQLKFDDGHSKIILPGISIQNLTLPNDLTSKLIKTGPVLIKNPTVKIQQLPMHKKDGNPSFSDFVVDIESLQVQNASIDYKNQEIGAALQGLSLSMSRTVFPAFSNLLKNVIKVEAVAAQIDMKNKFKLDCKGINVSKEKVGVKNINLASSTLKIGAQNISLPNTSLIDLIEAREISVIDIGRISAKGMIPEVETGSQPKRQVPTNIKKLNISYIDVDIQNRNRNIKLTGDHLSVNDIQISDSIQLSSCSAFLKDIEFKQGNQHVSIGNISLNTTSSSVIKNIKIEIDTIQIEVESIRTKKISFVPTIAIEDGLIVEAKATVGRTIKGEVDSLRIINLELPAAGPLLHNLIIYRPELSILISKKEKKNPPHPSQEIRIPIDNLSVYDGDVDVNNSKIKFRHIGSRSLNNLDSISGTDIEYILPSNRIRLDSLIFANSNLTLFHIVLSPELDSLKQIKKPFTTISASIDQTRLTGLNLKNVIRGYTAIDSVLVKNIELDIVRDKRLGFPPAVEKPFLLSEMIPKGISFSNSEINQMNLNYHEISAKTGLTGSIHLTNLNAISRLTPTQFSGFSGLQLSATSQIYNHGQINVEYTETSADEFTFDVNISDVDLPELNKIIMPLQMVEVKNGKLEDLQISAVANPEDAEVKGLMTYNDLHIIIHNHNDPERTGLGAELLTLLADGIILKHSKENASNALRQPRVKEKAIFNYWVKSVIHGSMSIIRHGKSINK